MTEVVRFTEEDYDELRRFIARTPKGRAFLREHERRSQKLAAEEVLRLINDLRESWREHANGVDSATKVEVLRRELQDMSASIVQARREIASLRPKDEGEGNDRIVTATNELDAIVQSTERASFEILNAAERMMELTGKLRSASAPAEICTDIESEISNIFTACSFQDLTGQRTRKVIQVLRYLEGRINAMIGIWGLDGAMSAEAAEHERTRPAEKALLNGPALPGQGLDQADVDMVMGPAEAGGSATELLTAVAPALQPAAQASAANDVYALEPAPETVKAAPAVAAPRSGLSAMAQAMVAPSDPLAAVNALSYEEKIALFS